MKIKEILLLVIVTVVITVIIILGLRLKNQSKQINMLKIELAKQKVDYILQLDSTSFSLTQQMIKSLAQRDSVVAIEFTKLKQQQFKLNKQYEKINADYSSIIIDRPDF